MVRLPRPLRNISPSTKALTRRPWWSAHSAVSALASAALRLQQEIEEAAVIYRAIDALAGRIFDSGRTMARYATGSAP